MEYLVEIAPSPFMASSKSLLFLATSLLVAGCSFSKSSGVGVSDEQTPVGGSLHDDADDAHGDDPPDDPSPQGEIFPIPLIDDSTIVVDASNYAAKRQELVSFIWGEAGFPTRMPAVETDVEPPVAGLPNVARVEKLDVEMDGGEKGFTHHIVAEKSNGRLVVFALGHLCGIADDDDPDDPTSDKGYGQLRTLEALLADGYSVLVTYMPHYDPTNCKDVKNVGHNGLFDRQVTSGSPVQWFFDPVAVSLNHLKQVGDGVRPYRDISMIGLSGGGWTTTLYAAIDPSITTSIQISGTVPLHLRSGSSIGDREQTLPELYSIAGYPDLYVLGATGEGRRQVQVLLRRDNCCFGARPGQYSVVAHGPWDRAMRAVEARVQERLATMGADQGSFRLEIDDAPDHHTISWNTLVGTVLAELNGGLRTVGAASADQAFVRHLGTFWEWTPAGWKDTQLRGVGTPAVVTRPTGELELFYRTPANRMARATRQPDGTWVETLLEPVIASDPVAVRTGDVTVLSAAGPEYQLVAMAFADGGPSNPLPFEKAGPRIAGPPAPVTSGSSLRWYARGVDRRLHLFGATLNGSTIVSAPTTDTTFGATVIDFPAVIHTSDGADRVFFRNLDGLHELVSTGASWTVGLVSERGTLRGSPAVSENDGVLQVRARGPAGALHTFEREGTEWTRERIGASLSDSLVPADTLVFAKDYTGSLCRSDGAQIDVLGRP